jgi:integrase
MDRDDAEGDKMMTLSPSEKPFALCSWPLALEHYDRSPDLRQEEHDELARLFEHSQEPIRSSTKHRLKRLVAPLEDALRLTCAPSNASSATIRIVCSEMHQRQTTFWAWSIDEWVALLGPNMAAFAERYQRTCLKHPARAYLPVIAYVLKTTPEAWRLFEYGEMLYPLAQKCFEKALIDKGVETLRMVLQSWGYHQEEQGSFVACVSYLCLRNGSPHLEDLTSALLAQIAQTCLLACVARYLPQIARALCELGMIERVLPDVHAQGTIRSGTDGSVSAEWLSWCQRWQMQCTSQDPWNTYYTLLKVGRWLQVSHPEVTSPADWTYELAIELVAAVNQMKVGEWSSQEHRSHIAASRMGQPLRPRAKTRILQSMRVFLRDCQEWQWIEVRLNPDRALRTPRSIGSLAGPDPRIVEKKAWAKVLWAAMNLEEDDLPKPRGQLRYPVELIRAVAVVWCFAALRSDEIVRLRVGCVRWQYEDVMIAETGERLPKDATCFLDIPVNKTETAYTKPVHPLVGKRINEWEQIRPKEQPKALDGKTSEPVQYLFSYRGKRLSNDYINKFLISYLCQKAGIPDEDSRGRITSHRARATIASMLYNAKNPLDIFQLQKYLGHKRLSSTQSYVAVDPTQLASQVSQAGYLEQNLATIEVLLDQDAVRGGAAARGEPWKYYDLGHGYCVNDFWAQCKHRMACARCPFYRPKESLADQILEGQANLLRMLEFVQLTEEEKLLVTEGIELHQALIEQLADTPTPTGLTPREMETLPGGETAVIPVKTVRRNVRKTHG